MPNKRQQKKNWKKWRGLKFTERHTEREMAARLMAQEEGPPKKTWWFHPKEEHYFDWLNSGGERNRVLAISAFSMNWFDAMVRLPLDQMPKLINHKDKETVSLAMYRLERGIL